MSFGSDEATIECITLELGQNVGALPLGYSSAYSSFYFVSGPIDSVKRYGTAIDLGENLTDIEE